MNLIRALDAYCLFSCQDQSHVYQMHNISVLLHIEDHHHDQINPLTIEDPPYFLFWLCKKIVLSQAAKTKVIHTSIVHSLW